MIKINNHCKLRDKALKINNANQPYQGPMLLRHLLLLMVLMLLISRVQLQAIQSSMQMRLLMRASMNMNKMPLNRMISFKWLSLTQIAMHQSDPKKLPLALFKIRKQMIQLFHARVHPVILILSCARFQSGISKVTSINLNPFQYLS